jgi:hypothetical protein
MLATSKARKLVAEDLRTGKGSPPNRTEMGPQELRPATGVRRVRL